MKKIQFTLDQQNELRTLYSEGVGRKRVGVHFGVSEGVIRRICRELGIEKYDRQPDDIEMDIISRYKDGLSMTNAGAPYGKPACSVALILNRRGVKSRSRVESHRIDKPPYTTGDILAEEYLNGASISKLCEKYDMPYGVVKARIVTEDVTLRSRSEVSINSFTDMGVQARHKESQRRRWATPDAREHHSKSMRASTQFHVAIQNQKGGNDIIGHHVAYDFDRPEAFVVDVARTFHGQIHNPKGQGVHERGYSLID
jgi:hypothetical protein